MLEVIVGQGLILFLFLGRFLLKFVRVFPEIVGRSILHMKGIGI